MKYEIYIRIQLISLFLIQLHFVIYFPIYFGFIIGISSFKQSNTCFLFEYFLLEVKKYFKISIAFFRCSFIFENFSS